MTRSQTLSIELSTTRQRLNELAGLETLTDEQRAECDTLTGSYKDQETQYRAALVSEGDEAEQRAAGHTAETAEQRERRELRGKAKLSRFIHAAIEKRGIDGAEAEYAAAADCPGLVPLELFGGTAEQRAAEWRARQSGSVEHRAVTDAPADANIARNQAPVVPAIFDRSVAPFLGIEMPTAGIGIASYPVLSTSLTGGIVAEDADAAETEGAFTVTDADPRRLTGALRIRREDVAKLTDLESSLRENLSMVISDEFDKQLVTGDNVSPNLDGVLRQLTNPNAPAASAETFGRFAAAFGSHIDGLYAAMPGDVRALVGPATMRHMVSTFGGANSDRSAYSYLSTEFGGVRASRRIADPANNIQQAIIRRTNPAGDRVAVAPVWGGLELIRDPYTQAGKGQISVTAIMLVGGVVMLRADAFVQDSFRLA